jgi:hypothetical protein
MTPFAMIEMALKELIEAKYEPAQGKVGGDLSYDGSSDLYVWLGLITGQATEIDGEWVLDIDCFAKTYGEAMNHALALETVLLGRRHVTSLMRLDNTSQNETPVERPWGDDTVFRIGATYVFTARRTG